MNKRTQHTKDLFEKAKREGTTIVDRGSDGELFFNLEKTEIIRNYDSWVIIPNGFPYDVMCSRHDMLVPKRPFNYIREATDQERHEYYAIKKQLDSEGIYESIIENFSENRSNTGHFHAHLVVWRK